MTRLSNTHLPRAALVLCSWVFLAACGPAAITPEQPAAVSTATIAGATGPTAIPRTNNPMDLILSTTTSTQDSGLLDAIIPLFEQQSNYRVKTIAVGSGAAIALGQRGEADVVLAHAPENEKQFVASGAGIDRQLIMYNDFILVGPSTTASSVRDKPDVLDALRTVAVDQATFISRGDNSGTHQLEQKLWEAAGITPQQQSWYVESGSGMGQTLQIADQRQAYTLTDRATYLAARQRLALVVAFEGDPQLVNIYHAIAVNPERFPQINGDGARALIQFLLAPQTQQLIGEFGRDTFGQGLFTPCAQNSCKLQNPDG
jgi:tungstate transport system substrate-binding protein